MCYNICGPCRPRRCLHGFARDDDPIIHLLCRFGENRIGDETKCRLMMIIDPTKTTGTTSNTTFRHHPPPRRQVPRLFLTTTVMTMTTSAATIIRPTMRFRHPPRLITGHFIRVTMRIVVAMMIVTKSTPILMMIMMIHRTNNKSSYQICHQIRTNTIRTLQLLIHLPQPHHAFVPEPHHRLNTNETTPTTMIIRTL